MEASNKQNRINKNGRGGGGGNLISNPSENLDAYAGILNPPPTLPPSRSMSLSFYYYQQNQQKPPLLPPPRGSTIHRPQPLLSRSLNSQGGVSLPPPPPPPNRKNRSKHMSLTPKKSKPTKREETKKRSGTQFLISVSDDNRWGPDPKDLPVILRVLPGKELPVDLSSESVFNLSPPPSSLPLPKFYLRSKLSCNTEAAGSVDAGATNNLRRLLRLR